MPLLPDPTAIQARLDAIVAERKALHADEYRRLKLLLRDYRKAGIPFERPAEPTPLLPPDDDDMTTVAESFPTTPRGRK